MAEPEISPVGYYMLHSCGDSADHQDACDGVFVWASSSEEALSLDPEKHRDPETVEVERMRLTLPDAQGFMKTPKGKPRAFEAARREWEAACRQSWRCLLLVVKAKLEAIDSGIATFEDEFLAYFVLEDGQTIGEKVAPRLDAIVKALTPLASLMYHQGYADALEASIRVVEMLGARPELVIESLRESVKDIRLKTEKPS